METKEYYVAYFDLLGVKNEYKKDKEHIISKLWEVNHHIEKKTYKTKCIVKSFSDNFLLAVSLWRNLFLAFFDF